MPAVQPGAGGDAMAAPIAWRTTTVEPSDGETSFELLRRARSGDAAAVDDLCRLYWPRLRRWVTGRIPPAARSAVDTGDVVQDVLFKAMRQLAAFEPQHPWSFQTYLRSAVLNRIRDLARVQRPPIESLDGRQASAEPSPLERAIAAEDVERYEAALARLRLEDQELIVARFEWGLDHQELAEMFGKPSAGASRVATHRAVASLVKEMAREHR